MLRAITTLVTSKITDSRTRFKPTQIKIRSSITSGRSRISSKPSAALSPTPDSHHNKTNTMASAFNLKENLAFYGAYHNHPLNQLVHFVFVPLIMWTVAVWLSYTPAIFKYNLVPVLSFLPPGIGQLAKYVSLSLVSLSAPPFSKFSQPFITQNLKPSPSLSTSRLAGTLSSTAPLFCLLSTPCTTSC